MGAKVKGKFSVGYIQFFIQKKIWKEGNVPKIERIALISLYRKCSESINLLTIEAQKS